MFAGAFKVIVDLEEAFKKYTYALCYVIKS